MWTYRQSTGELLQDGRFVAQGYSGHGHGKNNPAAQQEHNVGPLPAGAWRIAGPPVDTNSHGPYVLHLEPCNGTQTFGRSGFLIHGDSRRAPGEASQGCVILPRHIRERVWTSGDATLTVTT